MRDAAHVTRLDWASDPILAFPDVPQIDAVLIDHPAEPAGDVGEPMCAVIPVALGNAILDAIGVRLRTMPFMPERVKQALRQA